MAKLTIAFMVEPGPLELQGSILAHSLKLNCKDDFQIAAYCRDIYIDHLNPFTIEMLAQCGATIEPIKNPFEDNYHAGNKLVVADLDHGTDWVMFMDSDMILLKEAHFLNLSRQGHVSACVANVNVWSNEDKDWVRLLQRQSISDLPEKISLRKGDQSRPLFNAGLLLFENNGFGKDWLRNALDIDADASLKNKRPWLDTIAIPATLFRGNGYPMHTLPSTWNETTALQDDETIVLHYHGIRSLGDHQRIDVVNQVIKQSDLPFEGVVRMSKFYSRQLEIKGNLNRRALRHASLALKR
ncbi:MAG: hypothetical protein AAF198_11700 [Pseudomonadota bacterium]